MDEIGRRRRHHLQWLVLCAGILVASAILNPAPEGLTLPGLPGRSLPSLCVARNVFHVNCPGCGMTRSFVAMANGELRLAFALHRIGPVVFLLVLVQVPLRAYAVLTGALPRWARRPGLGERLSLLLVVALLANWVYNALTGAALGVN